MSAPTLDGIEALASQAQDQFTLQRYKAVRGWHWTAALDDKVATGATAREALENLTRNRAARGAENRSQR